MPKYKVGDVAALFPKPSAPKSDTGKKIQSMFDDFYKNSKKFEKNKTNRGSLSESPKDSKKKKRRYADIVDTEFNTQGDAQTQFKTKKAKLDSSHQNSNGKTTQEEENYFPRNKKKSKHFNSVKENSSAFTKMQFDKDEEESFSHFNSEQKVSDKKKKKNKLSVSEVFENNGDVKFKNKSSKKMKIFINSRNQSEEFNITDTNTFDEPMEEEQQPEKKSKKKKDKKQKKGKILQNEAVGQEVPSEPENLVIQNDESKFKQKSKKMKKFVSSENILNQSSEIEENSEEKNESSKVNPIKKKLQKKPAETAERLSRTLFVGNLPIKITRNALQKLFSPYGSIESCRLRGSVPVKVTIPKKIAFIKNQFHAGQKSFIGYVVFKDAKSASEALSLNGELVYDHHIVVNPASSTNEKKTYDEKRSIFIGNLPFDVEDEVIWSAFAACGEVEAVRAIRDQETGVGKGFGYVLFKNIDSKQAALKMENIEISNRKIRIKEIKSNLRKPVPSSNKLNAVKRKAMKMKNKRDGPNSRKSLKKLMNREKLNYQKKKIANIFKKFSI